MIRLPRWCHAVPYHTVWPYTHVALGEADTSRCRWLRGLTRPSHTWPSIHSTRSSPSCTASHWLIWIKFKSVLNYCNISSITRIKNTTFQGKQHNCYCTMLTCGCHRWRRQCSSETYIIISLDTSQSTVILGITGLGIRLFCIFPITLYTVDLTIKISQIEAFTGSRPTR